MSQLRHVIMQVVKRSGGATHHVEFCIDDNFAERLPRAMREGIKSRRLQLQSQVQTLQVVSPLATLARGYSILLDERGNAIRSAGQTHTGQRLKAKLGDGELQVRVEDNHLTPVTLSLLD